MTLFGRCGDVNVEHKEDMVRYNTPVNSQVYSSSQRAVRFAKSQERSFGHMNMPAHFR